MGSATSFSHGARGPHPRARARGDFAPRAGRRRSACTDERDDFVGTEASAGSQGHEFTVARLYPQSTGDLFPSARRETIGPGIGAPQLFDSRLEPRIARGLQTYLCYHITR